MVFFTAALSALIIGGSIFLKNYALLWAVPLILLIMVPICVFLGYKAKQEMYEEKVMAGSMAIAQMEERREWDDEDWLNK